MRAHEIIRSMIDKLEQIDAKIVNGTETAPQGDFSGDDKENATFVPPLQQSIELKKAALGKESEVVNDLLDNADDDGPVGEM